MSDDWVERTPEEWDALEDRAYALGREHGAACASWYFDSDTDLRTYQRVLDGIRDCDPETFDTFPASPLSGEWAGEPTPDTLREDLGGDLSDDELDELCSFYEDGFGVAVAETIEGECLRALAPGDAEGFDLSGAYRAEGWGGIAWRADYLLGPMIVAHMVGDDREFRFAPEQLTRIDDDDYCHECGQIGCRHDGRA